MKSVALNEKTRRIIGIITLLILFFLTLLRLGLFARAPYFLNTAAAFDEQNELDAAASLLRGGWLGEYNYTTLIKGISFPLFLVLAQEIAVSYPLLLGIFFVTASLIFSYGFFRLTNSKPGAAIAYFVSLYSPVGFLWTTQRIYRQALMYPAVLAVLGCILLVYAYRKEHIGRYILWLILLGVFFSFFYFIREDSAWLLAFMIPALGITAVWLLFFSDYSRKRKALRSVLLFIPCVMLLLFSVGQKAVNNQHYGVFETNDRTAGAFGELAGNLLRIEDPERSDVNVWLSGDTLKKVVDCCPTLTLYKDVIYDFYGPLGNGVGDAPGDLSIWNLRSLFNRLGFYESADMNEEFCRQINEELLSAVERGDLQFDERFHFTEQFRGLEGNEIPGFLKETVRCFWETNTFSQGNGGFQNAVRQVSEGDEKALRNAEGLTGANLIHSDKYETILSGWVFLLDPSATDLHVSIVNGNGETVTDEVEMIPRPDVSHIYQGFPSAENSGFLAVFSGSVNAGDLFLNVYNGDTLAGTYPPLTYADDTVALKIENLSAGAVDGNYAYSESYVTIANRLIQIGGWLQRLLLPVSLVCFVWVIIRFIRKRTWANFEPAAILLGVLAISFVYEFALTMFCMWLGESSLLFYSSSIPALMQGFELYAIYCVVHAAITARKAG